MISIFLGFLAFGFLIFIHELGHFWMAKRVGMKVEVFSVGFGPVLFSYLYKETKFQLALIPFGGYVKIKGQDSDQEGESSEGDYYSKSPFDRLKVVLAGPFMNIIFAFLGFSLIYFMGGREKDYSEFNNIIGFVEKGSAVDSHGIKAGDQLTSYNSHPIQSKKDLIYNLVLDTETAHLEGNKIHYFSGVRESYSINVTPKLQQISHLDFLTPGITTTGRFLIYNPDGVKGETIVPGSQMIESGIQPYDRIIWANGHLIFSHEQLHSILQSNEVLLTVLRGNETLLINVPKESVPDMLLSKEEKIELEDLALEANLKEGQVFNTMIHYKIEDDGFVTESLSHYQDKNVLLPKDRIIGVNGVPTLYAHQVYNELQNHKVQLIVARGDYHTKALSSIRNEIMKEISFEDLALLLKKVGTTDSIREVNQLRLLHPVEPMKTGEADQAIYRLGIMLRDQTVQYNPNPFVLISDAVQEIGTVLKGLLSGELAPKYMSGAIGILGVVQKGISEGFKDGLFWISVISLNLGLMNLLPIPVLDGGYVVLFLWEMVTKKRIQKKVLEKIVMPFFIILIGIFIFTTIHDLLRLSSFFR